MTPKERQRMIRELRIYDARPPYGDDGDQFDEHYHAQQRRYSWGITIASAVLAALVFAIGMVARGFG